MLEISFMRVLIVRLRNVGAAPRLAGLFLSPRTVGSTGGAYQPCDFTRGDGSLREERARAPKFWGRSEISG